MLWRLSALTAVVTIALTISSCSLREGAHSLTISPLTAQEADAAKLPDPISDTGTRSLATASGTIMMFTSYVDEGIGSTAGKLTTTVVSRERSTNRFQWAVSIKPAVADRKRTEDSNSAENPLHKYMEQSSVGSAIVSPDGRYLSLILLPAEQQAGETAADLRTHVVVLDTKTGKTIRDATVSGIVLGQALTNSALAVETAQNYFPAGSGKGTISTFSLTDRSTQPSSFATDKWLVGATRENLVLAPNLLPDFCRDRCWLTTVSLVNADGSTAGSISGVIGVHLGGWIHRFANPKAASEYRQHLKAASDDESKSLSPSREAAEEQLVDPSTKRTIDITGKSTFERGVPTGPGLLVEQEVPTGKGSTERKPVFWLSSSDDGHPHTENLEQFEDN
ncbi:hypothetical protein [Actinomyces oris]|uniref:Uncharacterized protein n=1 Tax=Actinomyces oris TaxID=544580 RepID=A0AAW9KL44_9ACTO|nr:hypothetical protein [Actinomyces oris]MEA1305706.1 hypothetical protein [Actinomyces oris]